MKVRIILLMCMVGAVSLCMSSCSKQAASPVNTAMVVFAVGDVQVKTGDVWSAVEQNMKIASGTDLRTGQKSQCNILIGENSYVSLKENTVIRIDSLLKDKNGMENNTVELKMGKTVINPKKLLKGEEFRVKTPTAIAAVRGTKFVVESTPDAEMRVSVVEGRVEMKKRIPALENADPEVIKKSPEMIAIQEQLDQETAVINENQSATIDNKKAAAVEQAVAAAITEITASQESGSTTPVSVSVPEITQKVTAVNIDFTPVKAQVVQEVKKLDQEIVVDKEKRKVGEAPLAQADEIETGELSISSPIKDSAIMVDGKLVGKGNAKISVPTAETHTVVITARGYNAFTREVKVKKGEVLTVQAEFIRDTPNDRVAWTERFGIISKARIVAAGDFVLALADSGEIKALNNAGKVQWQASVGSRVESSPLVANDMIFVVNGKNVLYAMKLANGAVVWKQNLSGTLLFGAAPVAAEGGVIIAQSNGQVVMYSFAGEQKWVNDIRCGIYCAPVCDGSSVFIAADNRMLYSLSTKNGSVSWKIKLDNRVVASSPIVADGNLLVGDYGGILYSIDIRKEKINWKYKTGDSIVTSPCAGGGMVYTGSKDGNVYALDAASGTLKFKYDASAPVVSQVAVVGGVLYVPTGNTVMALDALTGKNKWVHRFNGAIKAGAVVAGNSVFVTNGNGEVTALRADLRQIVR